MVTALPRRGDFGGAALAGARQLAIAQLTDTQPILGLHREGTYLWGTLHDDRGAATSFMRRIPPEGATSGTVGAGSLGGRLIVMSNSDADALVVRPEPKLAVSSDDVRRVAEDGQVTFKGEAAGRAGLRLRTDGDHLTYSEEGVLDLAGHRVGPALHWYLPGASGALYYPTQTWLVDGHALGREVRGFLFIEEAFMQQGGRLYVDKDPLHDVEYLTWYSWATQWEDGEQEYGHFLFGQGRFHVGLVANADGRVKAASAMDLVVQREADGYWHEGIKLTMDGEDWELVPDPRGRMELGDIPNPQQEGLMRRVGETRIPDVWMAWGETVPKNGERRTR